VTVTSSGTELIDTLVDGLRTGDNLVLVGEEGTPLELLVERFVDAARGRTPVVRVALAAPPPAYVADGVTLLDWSATTTGSVAGPDALPAEAGLTDALATLEAVDVEVGAGAAFVFDPLSAVPAAWGAEAALELFLATCPRLFRRRSLAVWTVVADHHPASFLRRLEEITQVVVELRDDAGRLRLEVRKADGRRPEVVGRSVHAEVADGDLVATDEPVAARARLGEVIRGRRLALGLPQAEVARRVGITPSALSQVERGVRGPSGDTLVRLWEVLEVPFGPDTTGDRGYTVTRRSGRERVQLQDGLEGERVATAPGGGETWLLVVRPGGAGDRGPFEVKAPETVVVLRGVVDLRLGGRTETLHEGDALRSTAAPVTGWANPGPEPAHVVWTVHDPRLP
jgi:transcriptional regulator with XRE-family HTH domain